MVSEFYIVIGLLGLCWGSFLNVVAYRLVFDRPFLTPRSHCPSCNSMIAWYDNIPLFSWLILSGKCRSCKQPISWVYPFIELITALCVLGLAHHIATTPYNETVALLTNAPTVPPLFFPYFIFFSTLILATASDLYAMVIPQIFSIWFVPVGILFAYFKQIPLTLTESILGCLAGYGILLITELIFKGITKKEGIGIGDMELLAMVGAFTGVLGVWITLMIGTTAGIIFGGSYLMISKKSKNTRIPFAPFLSGGAILYILFKETLLTLFRF
jgi:leader peptidase (prepilin peptidase) / N-methyltransferase